MSETPETTSQSIAEPGNCRKGLDPPPTPPAHHIPQNEILGPSLENMKQKR